MTGWIFFFIGLNSFLVGLCLGRLAAFCVTYCVLWWINAFYGGTVALWNRGPLRVQISRRWQLMRAMVANRRLMKGLWED